MDSMPRQRRNLVEGDEWIDYTPVSDYRYYLNTTTKRIHYEAYFDYIRAEKEYIDNDWWTNLDIWEFLHFVDQNSYKYVNCYYYPHQLKGS